MKRLGIIIISWILVSGLVLGAKNVKVTSPDGVICFQLMIQKGQLIYQTSMDQINVIEPSSMHLWVDSVEITHNASIKSVETYKKDERYPVRGVHSEAVYQSNGVKVSIECQNEVNYVLEIEAFNDGIAFRTVIPGDAEQIRIPDEATVFHPAAGSKVWYHDLYSHYEGVHVKKEISKIPARDWAAPPVTFKLPNEAGYASITEAAIINYAGMAFQADGQGGFITRLGHYSPACYPFAHDYRFNDALELSRPAAIQGTIMTPWRVVMIGKDLNTLVNSDILTDLSPPSDPELFPGGFDTEWIKPGRAVWAWLDGGKRNPEGMKEFSRLAGELGFEHNVVDAFWYRWTDEEIRDLVEYSKEQGVQVWLWRHGRDIRNAEDRRKFFKRCHDLGIVGVKLDAFSHESKAFIDLYQDCLRDAAEFHLMVNFHGSNKPAGETRTWPNEMTCEGIRGLEYSRNMTGWSVHNTTLPFTRFLAGHGDYTPMIFNDRRLETTWTHQIACAVVFTSPVIIYAAHPQGILDNPAVDIIKSIPTVWDETVVLPCSKIGELAVYARRNGDTWFLGILNGLEEQQFQIPLTFLGEGWYDARIACERPRSPETVRLEKAFTRATDTLPVWMPAGGGYVVRFEKVVLNKED